MQVTISTNDLEINDAGNIGGFILKGHESSTIIAQAGIELETVFKVGRNMHTASEKSSDQIAAIKNIGTELVGEFVKDGETYYSYEKKV